MPYIAFELDAMERTPEVARAIGLSVGETAWGLLQMWRWCWREKTDEVTRMHLRGFFGAEVEEALEAFGFIERGTTIRVRGAARYLRLSEARSKGGKAAAAAGNLRRGTSRPAGEPAGPAPSSSPAHPQQPPRPFSEQRAATSEQRIEEEAAPAAPIPIRPPVVAPTDKFATAEDFWAWTQFKRSQVGLVAEKPPHPGKLGSWWTEVHLELNGDPSRLEPAFFKFAESKHWESTTPPLPFAGFMSAWRNFAPAQRSA